MVILARMKVVVLVFTVVGIVFLAAGCCQKKEAAIQDSFHVKKDIEPITEPQKAAKPQTKEDRFFSSVRLGQLEQGVEIGRSILEDEKISIEGKIKVISGMRDLVYDFGPPPMAAEFEKEGYQFMRSLQLSGQEKSTAMLKYVQVSVEKNVELGRGKIALGMLKNVREDCSKVFLNPEIRNRFVMEIYKLEKKLEKAFSER